MFLSSFFNESSYYVHFHCKIIHLHTEYHFQNINMLPSYHFSFASFFYFRSGKWSIQIVSLPSMVKVSAPESVIRKGKHAVQWRRKHCLWLWKWHINRKKTFRRKCSIKPRHQCQWPSYWRWNSHTKCISQYRCNKSHICCYWWLFMLWG